MLTASSSFFPFFYISLWIISLVFNILGIDSKLVFAAVILYSIFYFAYDVSRLFIFACDLSLSAFWGENYYLLKLNYDSNYERDRLSNFVIFFRDVTYYLLAFNLFGYMIFFYYCFGTLDRVISGLLTIFRGVEHYFLFSY